MEKNEPALVPEWLRSSGSVSGSGNSAQQSASSPSSHSDVSSQAHNSRNRTSKSISDIDKLHDFLDWTSSSNSRRSSSNGSGRNAYSSFNRYHRDREKDTSSLGDPWVAKETLRRSHSMISRKQGELFTRRVAMDLKSGASNGLHFGSSVNCITPKAVFDQDFPSLLSEERHGGPDVGRVSSPGLTTTVQCLPIGTSTLIGREGWTSALAEVPTIVTGSSTAPSPVLQNVATNSGSGPSNVTTARKMSEALLQAPSRACAAPQSSELSIRTQRLEELAIKQSRQLIPVTPSMPKASVLNFFEKSKSKASSRSGELNMPAKVGQQQLPLLQHNSQPFRGAPVKSVSPKASHGKFLVLKPVRENGVSPALKDASSPPSNVNSRTASCQPSAATTPAALRNPNYLNISSSLDRKVASLDLKSGSTLEKKPMSSQSQSRNDFFNDIKKKTSLNGSTCLRDSGTLSPPIMEKSEIVDGEVDVAAAIPFTVTDGNVLTQNNNTAEEIVRFSEVGNKSLSPSISVRPDEKEAAFLRSLGWEAGSGEDEGLTPEEINAFFQQYTQFKPSSKQIQCTSRKPCSAP